MEGFLALLDPEIVWGHDGTAWAYLRYQVEGRADTLSFRGELLASHVLERQPDGSWKIVLAHLTPLPPGR